MGAKKVVPFKKKQEGEVFFDKEFFAVMREIKRNPKNSDAIERLAVYMQEFCRVFIRGTEEEKDRLIIERRELDFPGEKDPTVFFEKLLEIPSRHQSYECSHAAH